MKYPTPAEEEMKRLLGLYKETWFVVERAGRKIYFTPGTYCSDLDTWREKETWAVILADNPGSRILSEPVNIEARTLLMRASKGHLYYPAFSEARADWPSEYGLFICDISPEKAMEIGKQFGQNAILIGQDGKCEVRWCK